MRASKKIYYSQARQRKTQSLAFCLENFLAKQNYKINLVRLWQNWNFVLGPDLGELAIPLGHRKNVLLIGAEDNLIMQELSYASSEILALTNEFLGESYFHKIEFQLQQGRRSLNTAPLLQVKSPPLLEKPEKLGNLKIENPYYRSVYEAYVKAFEQ